jgi:hypothetical protein
MSRCAIGAIFVARNGSSNRLSVSDDHDGEMLEIEILLRDAHDIVAV